MDKKERKKDVKCKGGIKKLKMNEERKEEINERISETKKANK